MTTKQKNYSIPVPGLVLRDEIYKNQHGKYEQYFNDLYHLFMYKMSALTQGEKLGYTNEEKLRILFEQVLQARKLADREEA